MSCKYQHCIAQWDQIFKDSDLSVPTEKESGNEAFDKGLAWVTNGTKQILDFGCGNGSILFRCAHYGTRSHIGIDLSAQAISSAQLRSEKMVIGQYQFICGSLESLPQLANQSMGAVILSNIVDNLYPEDARTLLEEAARILRTDGKALIKVNPYLTQDKIKEYGATIIQDNLLNDGMLLWNNTTDEWVDILESYFSIERYESIYYEEHDQYNRMWCAKKK